MPLDLETQLVLQRVLAGPRQEREAALMELAPHVNRHPDDPDYLHALAHGLFSLGRHSEASEILAALVRDNPERWTWRIDLAASYLNSGRHELARACLNEVEAGAPSERAKANARELLDELGAREERDALRQRQIAVLREHVAATGAEQDAVLLARRLIEDGYSRADADSFYEATAVLERARERHGDSAAILENLILCYRERDPHGRHSEAIHALEALAPESDVLEGLTDPESRGPRTPARNEALRALDEGADFESAGDVPGARAAYQRAIDSGDPECAPVAGSALGRVLVRAGDHDGARAALQVAIDSGHRAARPKALRQLADLLRARGEIAGATAAYREVIESDHREEAAWAAISLGAMLEQQGDLDDARGYFSVALLSGQKVPAAAAGLAIGNMLARAGDFEGARMHYDIAVQGASYEAAAAWRNIAAIELRQGHQEAAREALEHAIAAGDPDVSPLAALDLGIALQHAEDWSGMRAAFARAIESDHPEAAPAAGRHLGEVAVHFGHRAVARPALERAIASEHPEHAPAASLQLGLLLEDEDDLEGAVEAFERAAASPDPEVRREAAEALAILGPIVRARRHLRGDPG